MYCNGGCLSVRKRFQSQHCSFHREQNRPAGLLLSLATSLPLPPRKEKLKRVVGAMDTTQAFMDPGQGMVGFSKHSRGKQFPCRFFNGQDSWPKGTPGRKEKPCHVGGGGRAGVSI